jgi:uncharacterized membrane protein AbrB (regulator of aidB expression)
MLNIKVISIIFINTVLISLGLNEVYNGKVFFIFILAIVGIANRKYLDSNNKLTNKQKWSIELSIIVVSVLSIFYTSYFM